MLIGMALLQLGFFTAELSTRTYLILAFAGLGLSTSIYSVGLEQVYRHGFPLLEQEGWFFLMYYLARETGMIGLASLVMLAVKRGLFSRTQRFLAAVGRTAFSNYILTSLLCQTLFVWGPLKLYGRLEYYQLMYVVAAVWVVNLLASRLWLRTSSSAAGVGVALAYLPALAADASIRKLLPHNFRLGNRRPGTGMEERTASLIQKHGAIERVALHGLEAGVADDAA
jgi:Protein of unknown function (DUF418)